MGPAQQLHETRERYEREVSGGEIAPSRVDARPSFEMAKTVRKAVTRTVEPPIHRALPFSPPLPWEVMFQTEACESAVKRVVIVCP